MHDQRAGNKVALVGVAIGNASHPASEHDRLVIAAHFAAGQNFQRAEIAGEIRPAEFVIECRAADRSVEHDLKRAGDARRSAVNAVDRSRACIAFPRLAEPRNIQIGHREAGQTCLWLRAPSGRSFVADFAARPGSGPGMRRDRGRMIVGLDFHQRVRQFGRVAVAAIGAGKQARHFGALHDRRIVAVGHHGSCRADRVGVADHRE